MTEERLVLLSEVEAEERLTRALMQRMTTARRGWWIYVGMMTLYAVVAGWDLIFHGSVV